MTTENSSDREQLTRTQQLLQRLKDRGLSQAEIVRRSGISQPKISRWERGLGTDSTDDVLRLQELERELEAANPIRQ